MKVWITQYALTSGIFEVDAEVKDGWIVYRRPKSNAPELARGDEWQPTYEKAMKRARAMRVKKLASLKKQIKRIEALKFGEAA